METTRPGVSKPAHELYLNIAIEFGRELTNADKGIIQIILSCYKNTFEKKPKLKKLLINIAVLLINIIAIVFLWVAYTEKMVEFAYASSTFVIFASLLGFYKEEKNHFKGIL